MPPEGRRGSVLTIPLTLTCPASIRRAIASPREVSVQMLAPSPYGVSLARERACSASSATITEATGPKVSSVQALIPASTPVSSVTG